jgi:hypothetical protein
LSCSFDSAFRDFRFAAAAAAERCTRCTSYAACTTVRGPGGRSSACTRAAATGMRFLHGAIIIQVGHVLACSKTERQAGSGREKTTPKHWEASSPH